MTRLLRACFDENTHAQIQTKMHDIFLDRGYPHTLVSRVMHSVKFSDRADKLRDRSREECQYDTFLVTECSPDMDAWNLPMSPSLALAL